LSGRTKGEMWFQHEDVIVSHLVERNKQDLPTLVNDKHESQVGPKFDVMFQSVQ
jgi:hypothetical protein